MQLVKMQETVKEKYTEMKLLKEMLSSKDKEIADLKTKLAIEKETMDLRVKDYEQKFKLLEDNFSKDRGVSSAKQKVRNEENKILTHFGQK